MLQSLAVVSMVAYIDKYNNLCRFKWH